MLLRFETENFLSMRDRVELSLIASPLKDSVEPLIETSMSPKVHVVSSALIYGANASGKSNLVSAFSYMRQFVMYSHSHGSPEGKINRRTFSLDEAFLHNPSTFEVDFIVNQIRHTYGFSLSDEEVVAEWLYNFPNNRRQLLFERDHQKFSFGRNLKGRNQTISDLTRRNSLFVSAAAQNDHQELVDVYRFFEEIEIHSEIDVSGVVASLVWKNQPEVDVRIIRFLADAGTGVVSYRRKEEEYDQPSKEFHKGLYQLIRSSLGSDIPGMERGESDKNVKIQLGHLSSTGDPVFFNLDRESSGTRRLLVLLAPIFRALDTGGIVIIDELDASLHTRACEAIVALFSEKQTNPKGAQLIATTHDTNLLSSDLIRRDQIWFCEKGDAGQTMLFPLTDIKVRGSDNFEKGYLQGRFGAIPFAGSFMEFLKHSKT